MVLIGKPCLAGTRLDVATIIDALGAGESYENVERDYEITREPDSVLRQRLAAEELVFLTNDTEFESLAGDCRAQVIISRVPQRWATYQRVEIWLKGLEAFIERKPRGKLFDLMPSGEIVAWEMRPLPRENT